MILERFSSLIATAIPRLKTWFPLLECRTKKEKKKKRVTVRVTKEEKEKKKKTEEWRDAESGKDRKKQDCNLCRFLFGELYQVAICLIDSYPLSFLLLALLAFFFTLCLLVGSSRPCQEENRPRHAICESYSHAFTAFRRRKKKKKSSMGILIIGGRIMPIIAALDDRRLGLSTMPYILFSRLFDGLLSI